MYAVIETGGKQYRVELGSEIEVDRMDVEPGQTIDLERVLLVADGDEAAIGQPVVDGARVSASVLRQSRGDKIVVFKYKPKARTRVKQGHRADLTVLRIADIAWAGRSAAKEQAKVDKEQQKPPPRPPRRPPPSRPPPTRRSPSSWPPLPPAAAAAAGRQAAPPKAAAKPAAKAAAKPPRGEAEPKAAEPEPAAETQPAAEPPRRPRRPRRPPSHEVTEAVDAGTDAATDDAPGRTSNSVAHKKAGSSSKNGRDSVGQRLGVKAGDGQLVQRRLDHRPPARHDVPGRPRHRPRPRLHRLRHGHRPCQVRARAPRQEADPHHRGRPRGTGRGTRRLAPGEPRS